MAKISVIIPVYNTEMFLSECLDSVLHQTFKDFEIICVNDGSSDNSASILKGYAQKDARIKVITQANQGLSAARNAGLDVVQGEWICFLDSDDMLPISAIEILYNTAQQTGCKIVASRARLQPGQSYSLVLPDSSVQVKNGLKDFVRDNKIFSSSCNKLFAADLFHTQRFTKGMLFEDWPVMTILFGNVHTYATTDIPCYTYREDNQSITRSSFSEKKLSSYIQGVKMVYDSYKNSDKLNMAQQRMMVALKMLVNKVYRAKDKNLNMLLLNEMQELFAQQIISKNKLPLKTRWRLWLMKH